MDMNVLKVIMGIIIFINIVGISVEWISLNTKLIKWDNSKLNLFYVIISMLGGFVGVLLGAEMFGLKENNKVLKRLIPTIVVIELIILLFVYYLKTK